MSLTEVCLSTPASKQTEGSRSAPAGSVGCNLDGPLSSSTGSPSSDGVGMMHEHVVDTPPFWDTVAQHVTAKVQPALRQKQRDREPVIAYLRDLEALAACRTEVGWPGRAAIGALVLADRRWFWSGTAV